jgi:beta-phosphoglucomutase-like phosphatase (HAD superfamily)
VSSGEPAYQEVVGERVTDEVMNRLTGA